MYTPDIFAAQSYGGISRYLVEIIKRLPKEKASVEVFAGIHINKYLEGISDVIGLRVPNLWTGSRWNSLSLRMRHVVNSFLMEYFARIDCDTIVHYSNYSMPLKKTAGRSVVTVHDMIHELFPEFFSPRDRTPRLKKMSCDFADRIIAVSNTTKNDLVQLLGIDERKITVIYHGNSLKNVTPSREKITDGHPFILYVGLRGGYKNFSALLEAYAQSSVLKHNLKLICFGGGPFTESETRWFQDLGVRNSVRYVAGDDSLLARCYSDARCYVCPSLYEGFGMPLVEAMGLGCPVICSSKGSIPEVAGDAAVYFDPQNVDSIQSVLESVVFDDIALDRVKGHGVERESQFSWEQSAIETFELYKSLIS